MNYYMGSLLQFVININSPNGLMGSFGRDQD